jgi:AraC-like DNA-binding protein
MAETIYFRGSPLSPLKLLTLVEYQPGEKDSYPMHRHETFQTVICLAGAFCFSGRGEESVTLGPWEAASVPPGLPHRWEISGDSVCRTLQICHSAAGTENFGELAKLFGPGAPKIIRKLSCPEETARPLIKKIEAEFENGGPVADLMVSLMVLELFALMLRASGDSSAPEPPADKALRAAMVFIRENFGRNISLSDIAAAAGLGVTRLSQIFRERTGRSPVRALNDIRMEKAAALIRHSDLSVTETAAKLGFSSVHYFSRAFKKSHGLSPADFRKH